MNKASLRFRRGDIIVIVTIVLIAVVLWVGLFSAQSGVKAASASIYHNGTLLCVLPTNRDTQYTVHGDYMTVITVKGGRIAVTESTCPGGDCMRSGWQDTSGRSIVCLPNRVEIVLNGDGDVDAYTQ